MHTRMTNLAQPLHVVGLRVVGVMRVDSVTDARLDDLRESATFALGSASHLPGEDRVLKLALGGKLLGVTQLVTCGITTGLRSRTFGRAVAITLGLPERVVRRAPLLRRFVWSGLAARAVASVAMSPLREAFMTYPTLHSKAV